jgi:hypothetical protein
MIFCVTYGFTKKYIRGFLDIPDALAIFFMSMSSALIISGMLTIFIGDIGSGWVQIIFIIVIGLSYLYFYTKDRYKTIYEDYKERVGIINTLLVLGYYFISILIPIYSFGLHDKYFYN